jgi:hypothetical protein
MNNEKMNQMIDEAYENYLEKMVYHPEENWLDDGDGKKNYRQLKKQEFINKCKTDSEFPETWGLRIEERELSLDDGTPIKEINIYHRLNKSVDFIECRITILPTKQ